uniref:Chromo domain-containing protein n=2 Tax=Graphocephala atropunctata TaxID=36148 RepID=A0A1B6KYB4_9HEMI
MGLEKGISDSENSNVEKDELVVNSSKKRGRALRGSLKGKAEKTGESSDEVGDSVVEEPKKRGRPSKTPTRKIMKTDNNSPRVVDSPKSQSKNKRKTTDDSDDDSVTNNKGSVTSVDEEEKTGESSDEVGDSVVEEPKKRGRPSKTPTRKIMKTDNNSPRVVDSPKSQSKNKRKTTDDSDDDSVTNNKGSVTSVDEEEKVADLSGEEDEENSVVESPKKRGRPKKAETPSKTSSRVVVKPNSKSKTPNKDKKKTVDSDDESETDGIYYEVDRIKEVYFRKDGSREFLVSWKGYKSNDDTWEPEAHLDCEDLIKKFMEKVQKAKGFSRKELREMDKRKQVVPVPHARIHCGYKLRNTGFRPFYEE